MNLAAGTVALEVENDLPVEALLVIERETWKQQAATAVEVTSLQEFRDLFPSDAVAPGQEMAIASLAVLFTDLKGSTDLYQRAGDPRAFSFVQNHFRYLTETVASCRGAWSRRWATPSWRRSGGRGTRWRRPSRCSGAGRTSRKGGRKGRGCC